MNTEERDLITRFIERVGGRPASAGGAFGSVPSTAPAQNLPPVDPDADRLIDALFARYPEARYRVTQMAFVQEHALVEAQNRINRLQWELTQAQQQAAAPQAPAASPWGQQAPAPQGQPPSRGLFGGLFGGNRPAGPAQQPQYSQPQYGQQQQYGAPPPPQYAPGYQPGMFQQRGSGFLGSALTTAAGVAGGMVAGNALMNMFSGGHGAAAAASTVSDPTAGASPWAATPDSGQGAWTPVEDQSGGAAAGGWSDPTSYTDPAPDSGWSDSAADDSSWTDPDQS